MSSQELQSVARELMNRSKVTMVTANGEDGYPLVKAMFKLENDGLTTCWFSTNTSSQRAQLFRRDARASVYFSDIATVEGVMLVGEMEVITDDLALKRRFWSEGCERYYPLGVTDPDYSILQFTAKWGRYYHQLQTASFQLAAPARGE